MISVLRQYEEDGYLITEYTKDGINVSHTVREFISEIEPEPVTPMPTLEDKINFLYYREKGLI